MSEIDTNPGTVQSAVLDTSDMAPGDAVPTRPSYRQLEDVILDESFPEVDLALRRGRHIHKGDERWYEFVVEAREHLETFYRRFGCELEQRSDGYFFLLPVTDGLGKRHLGVPEMIVGQGLALCYLDPRSVPSGGLVTREELLNQLAAVMGTDALMRTLNPKRKRVDERVMQRTVRQKVNEALRRLSQLGFVELLDGDQLRLAPSLMRFAEPVRGLDAPSEALKRLIERGEVSLGPGDAEADAEASEVDEADAESIDVSEKVDAHDETGLGDALGPHDRPEPHDAELEAEVANAADADDGSATDAEPEGHFRSRKAAADRADARAEEAANVIGADWFDTSVADATASDTSDVHTEPELREPDTDAARTDADGVDDDEAEPTISRASQVGDPSHTDTAYGAPANDGGAAQWSQREAPNGSSVSPTDMEVDWDNAPGEDA